MANQTAADLRSMFDQAGVSADSSYVADVKPVVLRSIVNLCLGHIQEEEDMRGKIAKQVEAVGLAAVLGQSKDDVDRALVSHELARWARRVIARAWVAKSRQELSDGLRLVERELRRDMLNRAGREYACSLFAHACMRVCDRADVQALDFIGTCIDRLGVETAVALN